MELKDEVANAQPMSKLMQSMDLPEGIQFRDLHGLFRFTDINGHGLPERERVPVTPESQEVELELCTQPPPFFHARITLRLTASGWDDKSAEPKISAAEFKQTVEEALGRLQEAKNRWVLEHQAIAE